MNTAITMQGLVPPDAILVGIEAYDKKQLLGLLAQHAATALGLETHVLSDILWEREKLGTTGIGQGIAIPHGRIPGLTSVRGFFARLATPIPFDSVDNLPVDLVFLLLAPEDAGADHLHALATVSRILREDTLCDKLRKAGDVAKLAKLLYNAPIAQAA